MGCFSGRLMSSARIQKLFCGIYSAFKCSFDEFVGEKVVSPSYSSAILGPPPVSIIFTFIPLMYITTAFITELLVMSLKFIFFTTFFQRQWAAFLGAWCPLPAFRSCFVEFTQHLNVLLMNLWGRKCSPWPTPLPSWLLPTFILL